MRPHNLAITQSSEGVVAELSLEKLENLLSRGVFGLGTGTLINRLQCDLPDVAASIFSLYAHHPYYVAPDFADFSVRVEPPSNLRRWFKRQVAFHLENDSPFEPLPREQAPAFLEWGLNWCIASYCHQWFSIHAASLERRGRSVILPAPPGSGKSTLCATLAFSGWRLLSDELTLISPTSGQCYALARPINLKNSSIDIIRKFAPDATWGPTVYDTAKGLVTHLQPPKESVQRMMEPASPSWIIFPKYEPGAEPLLTPKTKIGTFDELARNAFNYHILGETAFHVVADLVQRCDCYDFTYSHLEDAIEVFDWLVDTPLITT